MPPEAGPVLEACDGLPFALAVVGAMVANLVMAARGELDAFGRLCQAVVAVLPADEAVMIWALWLRAAAETGAGPAVLMIAHYVRWLPARELAALTVDPAGGELRRRAVRG